MQNVSVLVEIARFLFLGTLIFKMNLVQAMPIFELAHGGVGDDKQLPTTANLPPTDKIDPAIADLEERSHEVRRKSSASTTINLSAAAALAAAPEELAQNEQLLQQWAVALDQHARHLRMLKEIRRLNAERNGEEEAWRGFTEAPTILQTEQLTDAVSARRLELRTAQMFLSIVEGEITRYAARLGQAHKRLRLAVDQAEAKGMRDLRRQWSVQIAERRVQCDEAAVEAAAVGRLVTWEALNGLNKYIQFLERKISVARAQVRISRSDVDGMIAQIKEKRTALQKELQEAIASDGQLRSSLGKENSCETNKHENPTSPEWKNQVRNARLETSGHKVELYRGFLQLTEYAQSIWEDRYWATEPRALKQLRARQVHYSELLENLRQWKTLIEQSLSAVSDQVLRQALRIDDSRLTNAERAAARELHSTLQERAAMDLRAVGSLAFTEDLAARLHAELSEQVARSSFLQKIESISRDAAAVLQRLWGTELYIAEDSVIAGGKKISIPRSITIGKVVIALTIFVFGLLAARSAYRLTARFASETPAKLAAAVVALLALVIAMTSVRIPWTIFAFMGGALAIGVGFGAQTLVNNFISGIILQGERTIRVGDIVEVDEQRGQVMKMGFRHSLIARGDGSEVLVPNSQLLDRKLVNWTLTDDLVRHTVSVNVAYGEPTAEVSRLIAQAASEHPHVSKELPPQVLFDDFGEKALTFTLKFWLRLCPTVDGAKVSSDLRHRINTLFDQAGFTIFPPKAEPRIVAARPIKFPTESVRAI